jgi:hypothetical protein
MMDKEQMQKERDGCVSRAKNEWNVCGQPEMSGMGEETLENRMAFIFTLRCTDLKQPRCNLVFGSIPTMSSTAVRCHGCGRLFTPRGLSQHISRTQRADCRSAHDLLHMQSQPRSTPYLPQTPLLNPNVESWDMTEQPEFESLPLPGSDDGTGFTVFTCFPLIIHCCLVTDGDVDHASDRMDDNADTMDANTFETLSQHNNVSSVAHQEMDHSNGDHSSAQPPEGTGPLIIQTETGDSETSHPNVVIERFPHGHPGAPVAGIPQGASIYESAQDRLGESLWAPFRSQCDWETARWAKMRGPTSTATTELLAIPGVSV